MKKNINKIIMLESRKIGWRSEKGKTLCFPSPADFRFLRLSFMVLNRPKYSTAMAILTLANARCFYPTPRGRQKPVCPLKPFFCFFKFFYNSSFSKSFTRIKCKSFIFKKININQILSDIQVSNIYIFDYLFPEVNHLQSEKIKTMNQ